MVKHEIFETVVSSKSALKEGPSVGVEDLSIDEAIALAEQMFGRSSGVKVESLEDDTISITSSIAEFASPVAARTHGITTLERRKYGFIHVFSASSTDAGTSGMNEGYDFSLLKCMVQDSMFANNNIRGNTIHRKMTRQLEFRSS